jgi:dihydroxyacetone kinase
MNSILTPEDSRRVADALVEMARKIPEEIGDRIVGVMHHGCAHSFSDELIAAIRDAVSDGIDRVLSEGKIEAGHNQQSHE